LGKNKTQTYPIISETKLSPHILQEISLQAQNSTMLKKKKTMLKFIFILPKSIFEFAKSPGKLIYLL
jgi:hypothetical protein